jgi:hypothetical protein
VNCWKYDGAKVEWFNVQGSALPGLKNGQSDQKRNLTNCDSIFLTGLTGWTGYGYTKTK